VALSYADAAVPEKDRDSIERNTGEQQFDGESIAELVRIPLGTFANSKRRCNLRCHFPFALWTFDAPVQKKYRSLERGAIPGRRKVASHVLVGILLLIQGNYIPDSLTGF